MVSSKLLKKEKQSKRAVFQSKIAQNVQKRHRSESRLKAYGISAIAVSFLFLFILLWNISSNGYHAFFQTKILVPITYSESAVFGSGDTTLEKLQKGNYQRIIYSGLRGVFTKVKSRRDKRQLYSLVSKHAAYPLRDALLAKPSLVGFTENIWLNASSDVDIFYKRYIGDKKMRKTAKLSQKQLIWVRALYEQGRVKKVFNLDFFTHGDSREPESAGVFGGFVGSIFLVLACMSVAFPLGIMTAIYLEEFAPKNWLSQLIEVNINNLAAVPSIIFGLLGLAIYIQIAGIPRSSSLAGGLTLAMMAMPVVVITTRTALRTIPQSIRDAAVALGASKVQTTFHHVLPLAMPGIMTGTILSISRVLGETAPLLMIGMVAFIVDIPEDFFSPSSALPVQIYLWADSPEAGFVERTSAAIIVLLGLLSLFNAAAAYIRKKFEVKW
jgi:phosphate transport system permease protein